MWLGQWLSVRLGEMSSNGKFPSAEVEQYYNTAFLIWTYALKSVRACFPYVTYTLLTPSVVFSTFSLAPKSRLQQETRPTAQKTKRLLFCTWDLHCRPSQLISLQPEVTKVPKVKRHCIGLIGLIYLSAVIVICMRTKAGLFVSGPPCWKI